MKSKLQENLIKGDNLVKKKKYSAALQYYKKALEEDLDNISVYNKIIDTHKQVESKWTDQDFSDNLTWIMKKQELENPALKRVHSNLEETSVKITDLIKQMMKAEDDKIETDLVEKIVSFKERALYPLIEFLLNIKRVQVQIGKALKKRREEMKKD